MLENYSHFITNLDNEKYDENNELNEKLTKFALEKMYRDNEGRLVVPLLWSSQVSHLLGHNY